MTVNACAAGDAAEGDGWLTEAWRFKRKKLFLVPGDSPVGLRLPLASLPHLKPDQYPYITPVDPYEARGALRTFDAAFRLKTPESAPSIPSAPAPLDEPPAM